MSNLTFRSSSFKEWRQQADAILNQVPVQNTWYTVLAATGRYTRIRNITIRVETANETLEIEITIDGLTLLGNIAATFATTYMIRRSAWPLSGVELEPLVAASHNLEEIGHNVTVRLRKTTAAGAGGLSCRVVYAIA